MKAFVRTLAWVGCAGVIAACDGPAPEATATSTLQPLADNGVAHRVAQLEADTKTMSQRLQTFQGRMDGFQVETTQVKGALEALKTLLDTTPTASEPLRIVRGTISTNGTILQGTGFSVVKDDPDMPGRYYVTFDDPFPTTPTILLGAEDGAYPHVAQGLNIGFTVWTFQVIDQIGANDFDHWSDRAFDFMAIGPVGSPENPFPPGGGGFPGGEIGEGD